jgi:WhiB family redox-sensing transcriptional regulator
VAEIEEWTQLAKCRGHYELQDLLFFSDRGSGVIDAKRWCKGQNPEGTRIGDTVDDGRVCPVMAECLNYALDNHIGLGTWGGESERQRRMLQRIRRRQRNEG